jgi:hypothetical protein
MRRFAAIVAVGLAASAAAAQDKAEPPLKVRKIVVYKHGVGYFEREGRVTGTQQIALTFKSAQMKDLLKSLYAVDLSGGQIAAISYDTKDPLSKQLEDVLIRVPDQNALTQFLTQLKGARVEATLAGERTSGSVVGIEPITRQSPAGTSTSYKLILYRDDGKIQPVDLLEVSSLQLMDEALQRDLKRLLDTHLKAMHADRKSVVLSATGQGDRDIRVGYIIETPIWKTSYRLLFDADQKPLLQGWAILENTTDEDWDQVDVSFVAGSPMSFIMDLYTAYYPRRHEIAVGVAEAARPEPMAAVTGAPPPPGAFGGRAGGRRLEELEKAADKKADRPEARKQLANLAEVLEESMAPAAEGVSVGDLFAYKSKEKVSVKRGQAALVPILSERVDGGERVLFYRPTVSSRPMNSYYFKNATALTLEAGPVTVFDGSTCVGEGLLRKVLKKNMRDMIPFAVEAAVTVESKTNRRSDPVTRGTIANGVLTLTSTQNLETLYTVRSQLEKDTVLYLDHARSGGYTLAEPAKAEEEVEGHYRFKLELKAGQTLTLKILETIPSLQRMSLLGTPAETIQFHLQQRYLSAAARRFLGEVAATQGEINRFRQEEAELAQERTRLADDEARVRENLKVLRETAGELEMRKKYLLRMEQAEARIEQIVADLKDRAARRAGLERDLARKVQEFKDE